MNTEQESPAELVKNFKDCHKEMTDLSAEHKGLVEKYNADTE